MIAIGVTGADPDHPSARALSRRLRGAQIVPTADAHAMVFNGPTGAIDSALAAGKHVLVSATDELPRPALSRWTESAQQRSVHLSVINPDRYLRSLQLIRQQLDAGKLGEPGLLRIHRWTCSAERNVSVRDLDLALWFFGKAPDAIHAVANAGCTQIHLGFPGGGMALIDHATLPAGDGYYSLSLICAAGAAYADDHANTQLLYQGGAARSVHADEGVAPWTAILQEFVDAVTRGAGQTPFPTWRDVLAVRDAVARAMPSVHLHSRGE